MDFFFLLLLHLLLLHTYYISGNSRQSSFCLENCPLLSRELSTNSRQSSDSYFSSVKSSPGPDIKLAQIWLTNKSQPNTLHGNYLSSINMHATELCQISKDGHVKLWHPYIACILTELWMFPWSLYVSCMLAVQEKVLRGLWRFWGVYEDLARISEEEEEEWEEQEHWHFSSRFPMFHIRSMCYMKR